MWTPQPISNVEFVPVFIQTVWMPEPIISFAKRIIPHKAAVCFFYFLPSATGIFNYRPLHPLKLIQTPLGTILEPKNGF